MVSFELGKEIKKDVFRHVTSVQGQRKNSESPGGIEPQTFGFALRCRLPVSHKDSTVSEVYYEVHHLTITHGNFLILMV